jgi:hypothetical protein
MSSPYATAEETASVIRTATADELWLNDQLDRIAPHRGEIGDAADLTAMEVLVFELRDQVASVKQAISKYHTALNERKHGGVAQGAAISEIEGLLDMPWKAPS